MGVGFADTRAEVYVRYLRGGGGTGTTIQLVSPGVLSCDGGGRRKEKGREGTLDARWR